MKLIRKITLALTIHNSFRLFAIACSTAGIFITAYFLWGLLVDFFRIDFSFAIIGQVGDFLGGFVGTLFALSGTIFIYLSFASQTRHNKREAFESTFFQMIQLQRQNVSELNYTKFEREKFDTANHRKVFRLICAEFIECYSETQKFIKRFWIKDYILYEYRKSLSEITDIINPSIDIDEMAIIDICYSMIYYGVGKEGKEALLSNFKHKYSPEFCKSLIGFMGLKPKKENTVRWAIWENYISVTSDSLKEIHFKYEQFGKEDINKKILSQETNKMGGFNKYYGGHQHRLGHYFRHLFQTFKYLDSSKNLGDDEKIMYAKMARAQLSTYEQYLLFVNSISSIGMTWEFVSDGDKNFLGIIPDRIPLITRYGLIKNLPGEDFSDLKFSDYYPELKYESVELFEKITRKR